MPKNAHPPRGGPSKKPQAPVGAEDTSFIVFGNGKNEGKKGKKPAENTAKNGQDVKGGKGKAKEQVPQPEDGPKKPDTRTLIGGASWTGKLPMNMLSEHCQKQKWEKPIYDMVGF